MELSPAFFPIIFTVYLAVATVATDPNDVSRCPSNLLRTRYLKASSWDTCYEFHMEERTWRSASGTCYKRGGRLVTIREARIQTFLIKHLRQLRWPRRGLWIGANDRKNEMDWRWITGERVKDGYSKWAPGQPSCGLFCFEDCALMRWKERGGQWHDFRCNWIEDYSFICEFAMVPPPTTTTTTTTTTSPTTTTTTTTMTSTTTTKGTTTTQAKSTVLHLMMMDSVSSRENMTKAPVILYGSNMSRHGEVNQMESDSASLTSGSLVGLVLGLLIGLSCTVCFIFIILVRRRRRKQSIEEDIGVSYDNQYYAETPDVAYATGNSRQAAQGQVRDSNIGCASGGYKEDPNYLTSHSKEETLKQKAPNPPSPLHTRPPLVMNNYDTPPTVFNQRLVSNNRAGMNRRSCDSSMDGYKRMDRTQRRHPPTHKEEEEEENFYSEVDSNMKYTYDVPTSQLCMDYANGNAAMGLDKDYCGSNNIYYNEEENMYESLDHFTPSQDSDIKNPMNFSPKRIGRNAPDGEEDNMYVNSAKENHYVPLKTDENEYY